MVQAVHSLACPVAMAPALVVRQAAESTGSLSVTTDQRNTIIVACAYVLAILVLVRPRY